MINKVRELSQRLRLAIIKALVVSVDDTTAIQLLRISLLEGEEQEAVERIQPYGLSSVPPKNSESIVAEIGSRDHTVVIASDSSEHRPTGGENGEVTVYCMHGQKVKHNADGSTLVQASSGLVRVEASSGAIEINNGSITIEGNLTVTGTIEATGNVTSDAIVQGAIVVANPVPLTPATQVTLGLHIHPAPGTSPPVPGS